VTEAGNAALRRLLEAPIGAELGRGTYELRRDVVERFSRLLGYEGENDSGQVPRGKDARDVVPPGMIFVFSLRMGWELQLFPPGAIRMGDDNEFRTPAKIGDVLTSSLRLSQRFTRKERRFVNFLCETQNQHGDTVCTVEFTACLPGDRVQTS
jgi:hypothetical protein